VLIYLILFNGMGEAGVDIHWLDRVYISRATYIEQYINTPQLLHATKCLDCLRRLQRHPTETGTNDAYVDLPTATKLGTVLLPKMIFLMICLVLDPNVKLAYAEGKWDEDAKNDGVAKLESVFDLYYTPASSPSQAMAVAPKQETVGKIQYGQSWMRATVQAHKAQD